VSRASCSVPLLGVGKSYLVASSFLISPRPPTVVSPAFPHVVSFYGQAPSFTSRTFPLPLSHIRLFPRPRQTSLLFRSRSLLALYLFVLLPRAHARSLSRPFSRLTATDHSAGHVSRLLSSRARSLFDLFPLFSPVLAPTQA